MRREASAVLIVGAIVAIQALFSIAVLASDGGDPERAAKQAGEDRWVPSLAIISVAIGAVIGFGASYWISKVGIDYGNLERAGVTIRDRIYPVMKRSQYVVFPIWAFFLTTLVGIFPAVFASRITPARAMRRSF